MSGQYRAILLSVLMIGSMVAIGASGLAAAGPADNAGPPDHAEIPEDRVEFIDERSSSSDSSGGVGSDRSGGVGSDRSGDSGPPDFVSGLVPSSSVNAEGMDVEIRLHDSGPVLELTDEDVSDEREISVELDALRESLDVDDTDDLPDQVWGHNSESGEWVGDLEVDEDLGVATVTIPHFSTNSISFVGTIEIDADPAVDGDSFEYEVADSEEVEDGTLVYTGHDSTSDEERSWTMLEDQDTISFDVHGTESVDLDVTFSGAGSGPEQQWIYHETSSRIEGVAVDETTNTIYIGDDDSDIHAIDSGGSQEWTYTEHSDSVSELDVDESTGTLYSVSDDGEVHAIDSDPDTGGSQEWTYTEHTSELSSVAVDESRELVIVGYRDGEVHAIGSDPDTGGSQEWTYTEHSDTVWGVEIDQSTGTFYSVDGAGEIHAVDIGEKDVGGSDVDAQNWTNTTLTNDRWWDASIDASTQTLYVGGDNQNLVAFDADPDEGGDDVWTYNIGETIYGVAIDTESNVVYAGNGGDEALHAVESDPEDGGDGLWTYDDHKQHVVGIATSESENMVFAGDNEPELHAVEFLAEAVDPSISVDGETASYDGTLAGDETHSETLEGISTGSNNEDVSLTDGALDLDLSWTETTETIDPEVEISSDDGTQTISHGGTIEHGSTVDLSDSVDESLISGNVSVDVSVSESVDGPIGKVGLNYSHDAEIQQTTDYEGEAFSERYNVSNIWEQSREDARLRIPWASDRVIELREVVVEHDHGDHTTIDDDPDYHFEDGEVVIDIGSVEQGDETTVKATGSKVEVDNGELEVIEPTDLGQALSTEIELSDTVDGEPVMIDVSGTEIVDDNERAIFTRDESWLDADPSLRITPSSEHVRLNATDGSTAELYSTEVGVSIDSGTADVRPLTEDGDELDVEFIDGTGPVEIVYHDTTSGGWYRVLDVINDRVIDEDQASSPARFTVTTSGTFAIESFTPEAAISAATGAVTDDDGLVPTWLLLIGAITVSLGGLTVLSRRLGETSTRAGLAPIAIGGVVLAAVGVELGTGRDISSEILSAATGGVATGASGLAGAVGRLIGGFFGAIRDGIAGVFGAVASPEFIALVLSVGLLLAVVALDQRTDLEIPLPLYVGVTGFSLVWLLETISEGSVLANLGPGLEEVAPLVWLLLIGGGLAIVILWLRSRRPEITIGGDLE